jgi:hypothetical protein
MTDDSTRTAGKTPKLIPGARERNALTSRKPGAGGFATRLTVPTPVGSSMDADTVAGRQREGGGAPNQRITPSSDKT